MPIPLIIAIVILLVINGCFDFKFALWTFMVGVISSICFVVLTGVGIVGTFVFVIQMIAHFLGLQGLFG